MHAWAKMVKVKSATSLEGPSGRRLSPVSVAWSDKEYFHSPLDGMPVHLRVTPSIKFAGTHLYTWVERGIVGVKCLAQEHNTMSLASHMGKDGRDWNGLESWTFFLGWVKVFFWELSSPWSNNTFLFERILSCHFLPITLKSFPISSK